MRKKETRTDYTGIKTAFIIDQIKEDATALNNLIDQIIKAVENGQPVRRESVKIAITLNNLLKEIE